VICPATLVIEVPSSQRMVFNCVVVAAGAPWSHVGHASQWHGRGGSPHSDPVRLQMGGCGRMLEEVQAVSASVGEPIWPLRMPLTCCPSWFWHSFPQAFGKEPKPHWLGLHHLRT
jgi:hypothetical protein